MPNETSLYLYTFLPVHSSPTLFGQTVSGQGQPTNQYRLNCLDLARSQSPGQRGQRERDSSVKQLMKYSCSPGQLNHTRFHPCVSSLSSAFAASSSPTGWDDWPASDGLPTSRPCLYFSTSLSLTFLCVCVCVIYFSLVFSLSVLF